MKRFERSNGMDTALYKNYIYNRMTSFLTGYLATSVLEKAKIDSESGAGNELDRGNVKLLTTFHFVLELARRE